MQQPSAPVKNSNPGSMHKNETKPLNAVKKQPLSPSHPSQDLEKVYVQHRMLEEGDVQGKLVVRFSESGRRAT